MATRWGTRGEFLQACETAKMYGIDILIDAVLNVSFLHPPYSFFEYRDIFLFMKHKLGGDRLEAFQAVPVDENNRMKNIGPAREIEAC